jgi:hypothetical protein
MTAADGDAEPLRVPPWLTGNAPSSGAPQHPGPADPPPPVQDAPADQEVDPSLEWPAAPDRDGWHAAEEPSELRRLMAPWRPRLIVAGVATALSLLAILLVSALLGGTDAGPDRRAAPPAGDASQVDVSMPGPSPTEAAPASPTTPASPSASGAPASTAGPRSSPPPKYGPVPFEAEAAGNTLGGSAWVDRYPGASGGSIVRNIGDWGSRDGDGFVRFEHITVPVAGTYTLRLFHVNIDNERTRTAVITVAGRDPQRVTLNGGSTCCTASTLKVQLRKDANTITVSNPDGHAPSIDRIILSLP